MGKIYPEEVEKKAVQLYRLDEDTTYAQVGRDLGGISGETIRNWVRPIGGSPHPVGEVLGTQICQRPAAANRGPCVSYLPAWDRHQ